MKFTKMHGAGNDYIYINCFEYEIVNPSELAVRLSNRNFGIGSDGLVLIMPSETCDFRMRMFNSDGSEAQMCGNASRCIGKYVYDKGLTDKTEVTLETLAGVKTLCLSVENGKVQQVTVNMGAPVLAAQQIPMKLAYDKVIAYPVDIAGMRIALTAVSMGNPHAVTFVDKLDGVDVHGLGKILEKHELFPERTNVEFVEILNPTEVRMRVWERGTGETLACGTGACATVVAGVLNKLCSRRTTVHLLGGDLIIEWDKESNNVFLTGPAQISFEGEIEC